MTKLLTYRTTAAALLIAFGALLAACDQQGSSIPSTPVANTPVANTPVANTPVSTTASNTATGNTAVSSTPADTGPPEATIVSSMSTATVPAGSEGNTSQSGLDLLSLDPCKLLTQDDVKSAMGDAPYAPRQLSQSAYHTGCSYVEPTFEENSPRLFLSLDSTDTWDLHPANVQPVDGIGDAAQTLEFSGWRSLWVLLKSQVVVQLDIYPPDVEKAKQLALQAIKRLP